MTGLVTGGDRLQCNKRRIPSEDWVLASKKSLLCEDPSKLQNCKIPVGISEASLSGWERINIHMFLGEVSLSLHALC